MLEDVSLLANEPFMLYTVVTDIESSDKSVSNPFNK